MVGALMCLMYGTKPDPSSIVSELFKEVYSPTEKDLQGATKVVRYLKTTQERNRFSRNVVAIASAYCNAD